MTLTVQKKLYRICWIYCPEKMLRNGSGRLRVRYRKVKKSLGTARIVRWEWRRIFWTYVIDVGRWKLVE